MFERFFDAYKGKGFAFGTHCWSADPTMYEICGKLGYDYIWIDNEHGGMTLPMIHAGIIATHASQCAAIVRVPGHGVEDVKPVLEMDPQGIVFPMVNTPEQAEICAKHCKYPPFGTRSFGPLCANNYGLMSLDEYQEYAKHSVLCMTQCEHVDSIANLDAILEVPGVDVIICGPMDMSASMGKLGKLDDPEVVDGMNTIIRKCKAAKKPYGVSVGGGRWDVAKYWLENGASFVSVASAFDFVSAGSQALLKDVEDLHLR